MLVRLALTFFAVFFLGLGAVYLSNPKKILELHATLRHTLLNDAYISFHRRRIGSVLVLIGVVLLAAVWLDR